MSLSKSARKKEAFPYGLAATAAILTAAAGVALGLSTPQAAGLRAWLDSLLAFSSAQVTWYITRAAGIIAYLLLWLSTAWGLAIPSKLLDRWLNRAFTFDFHQFISLLSLGFLGLHMFILTADRFLPYSLAQILVPFLSDYRPLWVGVGVIAFYLCALVSITYYLRQRIGMKAFRAIHYASLLAYLGATAHGIFSGTDSSLPAVFLMYTGTFLVILFLTVYWLAMALQKRKAAEVPSQ